MATDVEMRTILILCNMPATTNVSDYGNIVHSV